MPLEIKALFQEGNYRLQHRNTTGDGRDKEHEEPEKTEPSAARHHGKDIRQSLEPEIESALFAGGCTVSAQTPCKFAGMSPGRELLIIR